MLSDGESGTGRSHWSESASAPLPSVQGEPLHAFRGRAQVWALSQPVDEQQGRGRHRALWTAPTSVFPGEGAPSPVGIRTLFIESAATDICPGSSHLTGTAQGPSTGLRQQRAGRAWARQDCLVAGDKGRLARPGREENLHRRRRCLEPWGAVGLGWTAGTGSPPVSPAGLASEHAGRAPFSTLVGAGAGCPRGPRPQGIGSPAQRAAQQSQARGQTPGRRRSRLAQLGCAFPSLPGPTEEGPVDWLLDRCPKNCRLTGGKSDGPLVFTLHMACFAGMREVRGRLAACPRRPGGLTEPQDELACWAVGLLSGAPLPPDLQCSRFEAGATGSAGARTRWPRPAQPGKMGSGPFPGQASAAAAPRLALQGPSAGTVSPTQNPGLS